MTNIRSQLSPHTELQTLTKLPDDALFRLLRDSKVTCAVTPEGGILVNPASISAETIAESLVTPMTTLLTQHDAVIRERLREVLRSEFEEVVRQLIRTLQHQTPNEPESA